MESSSVRPITADNLLLLVDQTVRLMARGYTPDELADLVAELLPRLRDHPWLGEFYGTVKQTVRQVYSDYFGWFECDPQTSIPFRTGSDPPATLRRWVIVTPLSRRLSRQMPTAITGGQRRS